MSLCGRISTLSRCLIETSTAKSRCDSPCNDIPIRRGCIEYLGWYSSRGTTWGIPRGEFRVVNAEHLSPPVVPSHCVIDHVMMATTDAIPPSLIQRYQAGTLQPSSSSEADQNEEHQSALTKVRIEQKPESH